MNKLILFTVNGKKVFAWSRFVMGFSFGLLSLSILGRSTFLWALALFVLALMTDEPARKFILSNNTIISIALYIGAILLMGLGFLNGNFAFPIWGAVIFILALISKKIL